GEHARVVAEAARSGGRFTPAGFVDPQPCAETVSRLGLPRLGGDEAMGTLAHLHAVLGIGGVNTAVRRRVVDRTTGSVAGWAAIVHATAWVSPTATVAEGAVIMA